jgi:hypothetical protein
LPQITCTAIFVILMRINNLYNDRVQEKNLLQLTFVVWW